ncbi:MAG TPA: hypothetical protein VFF73_05015 [Planctomycetota bacterium]|nr:hypothetical protein [Planctomycetota bacterium]
MKIVLVRDTSFPANAPSTRTKMERGLVRNVTFAEEVVCAREVLERGGVRDLSVPEDVPGARARMQPAAEEAPCSPGFLGRIKPQDARIPRWPQRSPRTQRNDPDSVVSVLSVAIKSIDRIRKTQSRGDRRGAGFTSLRLLCDLCGSALNAVRADPRGRPVAT